MVEKSLSCRKISVCFELKLFLGKSKNKTKMFSEITTFCLVYFFSLRRRCNLVQESDDVVQCLHHMRPSA